VAAPTHVGNGSQVDGLGSVTLVDPTGLATDDLKLIFITDRMSPGDDLSTRVPSGWSLAWRLERTTGHEAACYYRFHAGDSPPTVTTTGSDDLIAEMTAFRGVDTTTPFDVAYDAHGFASGTTTMTAFNAITPVTDHALALAFFDSVDDNAIGNPTAGWSIAFSGGGFDSTTNADDAHALIYKEITPAATTGKPSMDQTANGPDAYIIVMMALRPSTSTNATATPAVLTGTGSQPAPTITTTSNVAPAVLGATGAGQTPAIFTGQLTAPAVIPGAGSQPAPTISSSPKATPSVLGGAGTQPAPTLSSGQLVAPANLLATGTQPTPTVTSGGLTITATVLVAGHSHPAPTIDVVEPDPLPPFHLATEPPPAEWWLVAETAGVTRIVAQWDQLQLVQPVGPEADNVTFTMLGDDPVLRDFVELQTDFLVYRNAVLMARCRLTTIEDELDADAYIVTLTAIDYREILGHRAAWQYLEYVGVDKGTIVWNVIQHTQGLTSGNLGITQGDIATGVLGDLVVPIGAYLKKTLDENALAGAGFDWWIDPATRQLNVQSPLRYRDMQTTILEHGSNLKTLKRSSTSGAYTNADRVFGGDDTVSATASQLPDPRGRWERVESYPDVKVQQTVIDKAAELLTAGQAPLAAWSADLETNRWGYSVELLPGDVCTLRSQRGRLAVNRLVRVVERAFAVNADGDEQIRLGLRETSTSDSPAGRGPTIRTRDSDGFVDLLTDMRIRIEVLERAGGGGGLPGPGGPTDPGGGGDPGTGDIDDDMIEILTYSWDRGEFNLQGGAVTRFPDGGDDTAGTYERFTRPMFPSTAVLWTPGRATLDLHNVEASLGTGGVVLKICKRTSGGTETVLGTFTIAGGTGADSPSERKAIFTSIACTGSVGPTDVVYYQLDTTPGTTPNLFAAEVRVYGQYS
jgi:hypothetical protein